MEKRNPKILVLDDDMRLRELLKRYLSEQGFTVEALPDVAALDRALARERYDLLVLDLMLPGEDGLSVCRRIRADGNLIPIVMLTAMGEDMDRILGLETGADDYISKPFNPRELLARINAVLRRQPPSSLPAAPGTLPFDLRDFGEESPQARIPPKTRLVNCGIRWLACSSPSGLYHW